MLSKISWSSLIWILIPILAFYYGYVFIVYFRKDIFSFGVNNKKLTDSEGRHKNHLNNDTRDFTKLSKESNESNENSFTVVHELLEELKTLFINAGREKMIKEELIQAINSKLKTYPILAGTDLVEDIDTHITQEVKERCGLELLPEDLKRIWN
jgi:hypothetical protein